MLLTDHRKNQITKEIIKTYKRAVRDYSLKKGLGENIPFYAVDTNVILDYLYPQRDIKTSWKKEVNKLFETQRITIYPFILEETLYFLLSYYNSYKYVSELMKKLDKSNIRFVIHSRIEPKLPMNIEADLKRIPSLYLEKNDLRLLSWSIYERGEVISRDHAINLINFRYEIGPDLRFATTLELKFEGTWEALLNKI